MFVVAGVSGNTGSVVANTLLSEGHPVRVVVRDASKGARWQALGAEVAVADLEGPPKDLERAFAGATGVYLLVPPWMREDFLEAQTRAVRTAVGALKAAGVAHTVFLSSIGAQHAAGTGPIVIAHRGEAEIVSAGLDATFVRACFFMENLANGLQPAMAHGVLPTRGDPTHPLSMIASDDIGRTAARALLAPKKGQHIVNLSHPTLYSQNDAAAAIGRALGRPVKAARTADDQIAETLIGHGLPRALAGALQEMTVGASKGLLQFEPGHETAHGTVSLDAFATRLVWTTTKDKPGV